MSTPASSLRDTATRLRSIAASAIPPALLRGDADVISAFRDEMGNRLAVDDALLASALGGSPPTLPSATSTADLAIWSAALSNPPHSPALAAGEGAPLLVHPTDATIEVWTESELSALHALWKLARRSGDAALRTRCIAAAIWHAENIQPDNATNHPWATHVFYAAGAAIDRWDLRHHADTLVHNALVGGRVRVRSAVILLDSARELEAI